MNRQHTWPADPLMAVEHGALLRWVGRLQQGMDHLVTQAQALAAAQEAEILRLRGQLLVARTAALWGMAGIRRSTPAPRSPAVATPVKERRPGPWSASMVAGAVLAGGLYARLCAR
jgi:hypothetical protein